MNPAFSSARHEATLWAKGSAKIRVSENVSNASSVKARIASVITPRPRYCAPSQYPSSADTRSTSVPSLRPMVPTACPSMTIAGDRAETGSGYAR